MKTLYNLSTILNVIQKHAPAFTRQTLYDHIDDRTLVTVRNPSKAQGRYKVTLADAVDYIAGQLGWDHPRARAALQARQKAPF